MTSTTSASSCLSALRRSAFEGLDRVLRESGQAQTPAMFASSCSRSDRPWVGFLRVSLAQELLLDIDHAGPILPLHCKRAHLGLVQAFSLA